MDGETITQPAVRTAHMGALARRVYDSARHQWCRTMHSGALNWRFTPGYVTGRYECPTCLLEHTVRLR
jgi:hypothetical protein